MEKSNMKQESENWKNLLELKLKKDKVSLNELYNIFVDMKNSGLDNEFAKNVLNDLRDFEKWSEEKDDIIVEMGDFVWGWYQPKYRIW